VFWKPEAAVRPQCVGCGHEQTTWHETSDNFVCCFLQTLIKEMSHFVNILDTFHNMDDLGNVLVPLVKFDEIKRRCVTYLVNFCYYWLFFNIYIPTWTLKDNTYPFCLPYIIRSSVPIWKWNNSLPPVFENSLTDIRVTAKYQGIKLEYRENRHTVLDLLGRISAKLLTWKAPYGSQETLLLLLQDWHVRIWKSRT